MSNTAWLTGFTRSVVKRSEVEWGEDLEAWSDGVDVPRAAWADVPRVALRLFLLLLVGRWLGSILAYLDFTANQV